MTIARARRNTPRRRVPSPRLGVRRRSGSFSVPAQLGATAWYDSLDLLTTGQQTLTSRVGSGVAQLGSTAGVDTNDPTITITTRSYMSLTTDDYLQLPIGDKPVMTATTGAFSVMVLTRRAAILGTWNCLWASNLLNDDGARLLIAPNAQAVTLWLAGATTSASAALAAGSAPISSTMYCFGASMNAGTATMYSSATDTSTTINYSGVGTMSLTAPRAGAVANSVGFPMTGDLFAVVQAQDVAWSVTNMRTLSTFLLGTYT